MSEFVLKRVVCLDKGTYKTSSKWRIIIAKDKNEIEFDYHMGAAHRYHKHSKKKVEIPYNKKLTVHDLEVLNLTEPEEPKLKDVLYNLLSDACIYLYYPDIDSFQSEFNPNGKVSEIIEGFSFCEKAYRFFKSCGISDERLSQLQIEIDQ